MPVPKLRENSMQEGYFRSNKLLNKKQKYYRKLYEQKMIQIDCDRCLHVFQKANFCDYITQKEALLYISLNGILSKTHTPLVNPLSLHLRFFPNDQKSAVNAIFIYYSHSCLTDMKLFLLLLYSSQNIHTSITSLYITEF